MLARRFAQTVAVAFGLALVAAVEAPSSAYGAGSGGLSAPLVPGRAWLGIAMEKVGDGAGVRVTHVLRGSPAEKAGLKQGDLIRAIDREKVASPEDVSRVVWNHAPGDPIVASLSRAGDALTIRVALALRPSTDEML